MSGSFGGYFMENLPSLGIKAEPHIAQLRAKLDEHAHYVREHGDDLPEIRDWRWNAANEGNPAT